MTGDRRGSGRMPSNERDTDGSALRNDSSIRSYELRLSHIRANYVRPEIQMFVGALAGQGAKSLFRISWAMDHESVFRSGAAGKSSRSGVYGIIFR